MGKRNNLLEEYPDLEFLFADGFDDAIIGVDVQSFRVVYDASIMVDILISEGMDDTDAISFLEHNVFCSFVGEQTPIYINRI